MELVIEVEKLRVSDGMENGIALGPIQYHLQFERVKHLLADIESQKLKLATGSTGASTVGKGYFITPTVVGTLQKTQGLWLRSRSVCFS